MKNWKLVEIRSSKLGKERTGELRLLWKGYTADGRWCLWHIFKDFPIKECPPLDMNQIDYSDLQDDTLEILRNRGIRIWESVNNYD